MNFPTIRILPNNIFALLALCALMVSAGLHAQQKQVLNLALQHRLASMEPGETIDVYLRGDITALTTFVRNHDGKLKGSQKNILSCALPAGVLSDLNNLEGLEYVEYYSGKPQMLNDVMLTNNNINPVHAGAAPLPQAYQGEDIILGFVDSGIELDHPDFQNANGSTRVLALWDQTQDEAIPFRVPEPYGYGQEWTAEDIDSDITNHDDQASYFGHGSTVSGTAAGNANASGEFLGVAPEADIIAVSSDFGRPNWKASVAEAVGYIFKRADDLGKPAVVNLSLGDYYGSHDGLDAPALFIDSLLDASNGRAVVSAAGNSGNVGDYHLSYNIPETDTAFTWFQYNANALGGSVFYELWADTADFNGANFTVGADLTEPEYEFRGFAGWRTATGNLNTIVKDTIFYNELMLGVVETWVGQRGGQYQIQVKVTEPFSTNYLWRLATTGGGTFDCWSHAPFGSSAIINTNLPDAGFFPDINQYELPDNEKTIVDSWNCSDKVITVGNYNNRDEFVNYLGETTTYDDIPGTISINCSRGPTRDNRQKPDIAASGDHTLSAGRIATLNQFINLEPHKVAEDGWHYINGGTSMASPVVAGVAALYFERDSAANYQDVKSAIMNNALADQFTGLLPGNQFGYGKLNAFAALTGPFDPVGVADFETRGLKIFPNPAENRVFIACGNRKMTEIKLYDMMGKQVYSKKVNNPAGLMETLSVGRFDAGVYLIGVDFKSGEVANSRLILAR